MRRLSKTDERSHRDERATSSRQGQGDSPQPMGHVFLGEFYFTPDASLMDVSVTEKPTKKPPGDTKRSSDTPHTSTRRSKEAATSQPPPQNGEPTPQTAKPVLQKTEPIPQNGEPIPQNAEPTPQTAQPAPKKAELTPETSKTAIPVDSIKSDQSALRKQTEGSEKLGPRKKRRLKRDLPQKSSTVRALTNPHRINQTIEPSNIELPRSNAISNKESGQENGRGQESDEGLSYVGYTKSMHGLRGKYTAGGFVSSASSTLSESESIIWNTTYLKKPIEIGSEESLEWKLFKSAVKPEGESTESSSTETEREGNLKEQQRPSAASKRKTEGGNEEPVPYGDNLAQRLRSLLSQYLMRRPERRVDVDPEWPVDLENRENVEKAPTQPIQIGSDLFYSTQPSQASFQSLASPALSFLPEDRPPPLQERISQGDQDTSEMPGGLSKEIIPSITSVPKMFENVKIPKNLAHIKDLDERLIQDPMLGEISTGSQADDDSDTEAESSSSTSLEPKEESFVWSGKFEKSMREKIPSEDGQIREWISFLSTRRRPSSNSEEDTSDEESEVEITPENVVQIEPTHIEPTQIEPTQIEPTQIETDRQSIGSNRLDPERVLLHRSHEAPRLSTIRDAQPHPDLMRSHETAFLKVNPSDLSDDEAIGIDTQPSRATLYLDLSPSSLYVDDDRPLEWTWRPSDGSSRSESIPRLRRSIESPRISTMVDELNAFRSLPQPDDGLQSPSSKRSKISIRESDRKVDRFTARNTIDFADPRLSLMRGESRTSMSSQYSRKSRMRSMTSMLKSNLKAGNVFVYMVIPPDGGYGWIVMVMSFLCQMIVDGIIFGIGLLLPDMAADLHVDPQEVTLVASMQIGFYFLAGSFNSALINQYGFRPIAAVGTLLSVITIVLSTFSQSLGQLIFLYSVIAGPTLSMIWVSSQLIIGYYFERNRPIANGISCSGAGAGIIIFSMMNGYLVPEIGWRNTSRVHAMILCSVFLLCITYVEVRPTRVGIVKEINPSDSDESSDEVTGKFVRYSVRQSFVSEAAANFDEMLEPYYEVPKEKKSLFRRICGDCCLGPQPLKSDMERATARGLVIRTDPIERQDLYYTGPVEYERTTGTESRESFEYSDMEIVDDRKHSVKQINYKLSMMQSAREPPARRQTYSELKDQASNPLLEYLKPKNWAHPKLRAAFRKLFDFRLLTIMEFQVLFASAFLFPMGFNIPFVYSKLRAEIDPVYAFFITPLIGASNFVFRIVCGFLAQRHRTWTTYLCGGGIFFGGNAVFVSALYGQDLIWFQYMYAVFYGVAPAFYSTLRAIIYVRSLGLDKLTNAFGMTALAMGCGVFVGTTLAGIMNQQTGSYTASFAFGGLCIMTSGALKLMLPTFMRWKEERRTAVRRVTFN